MLYKTRAIILGVREIKEADNLVTFYSEDRGKIRAVAKGIRRTKSKFGSRLEPFTLSRLILYKKGKPPASFIPHEQQSMDIITDAEIENYFHELRESLWGYACCNYYAELTSELIREGESNNSVFYLLHRFLRLTGDPEYIRHAEKGRISMFAVLIFGFTLRLLDILGYAPQINQCIGCGAKIHDIRKFIKFYFSVELGGILCRNCAKKHDSAFELQRSTAGYLRQLVSMEPDRLMTLRLLSGCMSEIEKLLSNYLIFHLDKEVRSINFLREIGILSLKETTEAQRHREYSFQKTKVKAEISNLTFSSAKP